MLDGDGGVRWLLLITKGIAIGIAHAGSNRNNTIKHVKDARIDVDKVKAIARDSNAGILADNISVTLFEAQVIPRTTVTSSAAATKSIAFWIAMIGLTVLVAGAGVWLYNNRFGSSRLAKTASAKAIVPSINATERPAAHGVSGDD